MIVKKAYNMAGLMHVPVLGIVENFSYLKCPDCGREIKLFGESNIDETAKELGIEPEISSFHAGAETHIYANRTNAKGEKFSPYLLGLATVCNMHSAREYLDYKTMIKGQELLRELFLEFNN